MSANFSLNDRTTSGQFTDKLCSAADPLFQRALNEDFVQKLMMKGVKSDEDNTRARRWITDVVHFNTTFFPIAERIVNSEDATEEEKQFLKQMMEGITSLIPKYIEKYEKIFGKAFSGPMNMALYLDHLYQLNNANHGFLQAMVGFFASFYFGTRVYDYLKQHPEYETNTLAQMLAFEDFGLKPAITAMRQLMDKKAENLSEDEVKAMEDVFRRGIAKEMIIYKAQYCGAEALLYM